MSSDRKPASPPAEGERLQKLLSRAGIASRRAAEEMIRGGRVTINGRIAEIGDRARLERDAVKVDGRLLHVPRTSHTLALNKPVGVVTTLSDPEGRRTVLDLVPPRLRKGLFPVGRLDFATEGLLLLTTDGDLAQQVGHPSFGCRKLYETKVRGNPSEAALDRLRRGMRLHGERLAPVEIERRIPPGPKRTDREITNTWWRVTLVQGKTRQIREMFQRIGHPVSRLRRVQIGPIKLHGLPPGGIRELGEDEIASLTKSLEYGARQTAKGKPTSTRRAPTRRPVSERESSTSDRGGARKTRGKSGGRAPAGKASPSKPSRPKGGVRSRSAPSTKPPGEKARPTSGKFTKSAPKRPRRPAGAKKNRP